MRKKCLHQNFWFEAFFIFGNLDIPRYAFVIQNNREYRVTVNRICNWLMADENNRALALSPLLIENRQRQFVANNVMSLPSDIQPVV